MSAATIFVTEVESIQSQSLVSSIRITFHTHVFTVSRLFSEKNFTCYFGYADGVGLASHELHPA